MGDLIGNRSDLIDIMQNRQELYGKFVKIYFKRLIKDFFEIFLPHKIKVKIKQRKISRLKLSEAKNMLRTHVWNVPDSQVY